MNTRCPACRARLNDTVLCPRCGCDLTLPQRAAVRAQQYACRAIHAWASGEPEHSRRWAQRALALHRAPFCEAVWRWVGGS